MKNFVFYNPVKIYFGEGQISKLSNEIPKDATVLMTYGGGSIFRNGVYEQVKLALANYKVLEFGGIEPNPRYETLIKALPIIKENKVDFLLALGGGSVIDGTKFISAASFYEGDPWDFISKGIRVQKALPIGVVLTLPATGSEMNSGAVISKESTKEKCSFFSPLVFPRFSVTDPSFTFSLPPRQVANGIVDAFIHTMEQCLTYPVSAPLQDRMAESILNTLMEEGPKAFTKPYDYDTRANIMWCATLALNGLIACGVPTDWATHGIGHELTALHGLDHALTLAIVFPGVMKVMQDEKREKILQYGERVLKITQGTEKERIEQAILKTDEFFRSLGMKTRLSENGIDQDAIETIVERFSKPRMICLGENQSITPVKIRQILLDRL